MMKFLTSPSVRTTIWTICVCLSPALAVYGQLNTVTGFRGEDARKQFELEKEFDKHLDAENIGNTIRMYSAKPHHLGSAGSKEVADSIYNRLKAYGWNPRMETYQVLFPTPTLRRLEMIAPRKYTALLSEPLLKEDHSIGQAGQLPPYNAWSADGDVTAELVFVNYGLPDDYKMLERYGIDVKGKIVIAKYGNSWRGIKPKVAQEHGAIGCIIYSDPADDGYVWGDVYPKGPFKNQHGVQRGSVLDMPVYPGDPLTPGRGATINADRIERSAAENLLKIPVIPISYHDAQPLLASLEGPVAPRGWVGGLPITYHLGAGKTKVRLRLSFNWDIVPCYNVVATIPGSVFPDEWIVRGNHHDAWNNGANDPVSGVAALMEEAKAIGALLKTGWKPKRTLVYCLWDGEEPGLLGSTEFVEDHLDTLRGKAVVYINSDGNGRGFLSAGGSHALQTFMNEIARDVTDPQTGVSVLERLLARQAMFAGNAEERKKALARKSFDLYPLGSGSDYSPFLQHAGIPTLNIAYGGENHGGEYHSIYDSYEHYRRFKDPSFLYGVTLAKTIGRAVLRLADADLLPFEYRQLSSMIGNYTAEVQALIDNKRLDAQIDRRFEAANIYAITTDTALHMKPPEPKSDVPYLDFSPLQNAVNALRTRTDSLYAFLQTTTAVSSVATTPGAKQPAVSNSSVGTAADRASNVQAINRLLFQAEQQLMLPEGLPRRSWYRHSVYAPGFYTGYGVKTLPIIREAIEEGQWEEAQLGIVKTAEAVERLTKYLEQIKR